MMYRYTDAATQEDRERAAEARHGGRLITHYIARAILPEYHGGFPFATVQNRTVLAGNGARFNYPDDALRTMWARSLSPGGSMGNGADTTASLARNMAQRGYWHSRSAESPTLTLAAAEVMMGWPIYRAAMTVNPCLWCDRTDGTHTAICTSANAAEARLREIAPLEGDR